MTATGSAFEPYASVELSLERISNSLDRLVALQADARAPAGEVVLEWLSNLDHAALNDAVMRRQKLGTPVMFVVIEVLTEWAADARS